MDAPFGKVLEITEINSNFLIAEKEWKIEFISNAPIGWKIGDRVRLSESPKLGSRRGSTDVSTSMVQVQNLDKKSAPITVSWEGSIVREKSLDQPSQPQISLKKNIRVGRELTIKKEFPNYVIQLEDSTKWQLYKDSGRYREINWREKDVVELSKGIGRPNEDSIKYFMENKTKSQKLLVVFISED